MPGRRFPDSRAHRYRSIRAGKRRNAERKKAVRNRTHTIALRTRNFFRERFFPDASGSVRPHTFRAVRICKDPDDGVLACAVFCQQHLFSGNGVGSDAGQKSVCFFRGFCKKRHKRFCQCGFSGFARSGQEQMLFTADLKRSQNRGCC